MVLVAEICIVVQSVMVGYKPWSGVVRGNRTLQDLLTESTLGHMRDRRCAFVHVYNHVRLDELEGTKANFHHRGRMYCVCESE